MHFQSTSNIEVLLFSHGRWNQLWHVSPGWNMCQLCECIHMHGCGMPTYGLNIDVYSVLKYGKDLLIILLLLLILVWLCLPKTVRFFQESCINFILMFSCAIVRASSSTTNFWGKIADSASRTLDGRTIAARFFVLFQAKKWSQRIIAMQINFCGQLVADISPNIFFNLNNS